MRAIFFTLVAVNLVMLAVFLYQSSTDAPPAPVTITPPASAAARLVLLGEQQAPDRVAGRPVAERQRVASAPEQPGAGQSLCTVVGPFKQHLPAEYFVEHLQALDVAASVVLLEVPGKPNYWVYQKPESSRKAALRRLHELQAKGIDSFVIPRGDLENGISFGVFSDAGRAEVRAAEIRAMGYAAEVRPRPRTFEEIWVSMVREQATKVAAESWLELLNREPGLEKREILCPAVAS